MSNFTRKWTDEQIKRVLSLHNKNIPSSLIAREFGVTKNSICGLIWRVNHRKDNGYKRYRLVEKKKPLDRLVINGPIKIETPISMHLLQEGMCREIIGEPRNLVICGCRTNGKSPYCHNHAVVNYQ